MEGSWEELEHEEVFGWRVTVEKRVTSAVNGGVDELREYRMSWKGGRFTYKAKNATKKQALMTLRRFLRSFNKKLPDGDFYYEDEYYNNYNNPVEVRDGDYEWIDRVRKFPDDDRVPWNFMHSSMRIQVKPADRSGDNVRVHYKALVERDDEIIRPEKGHLHL